MDKEQILTKIQDCGIVAVVRAESADQASRIADACIEGGVAAIELTFTVPHADKVIEELAKRYTPEQMMDDITRAVFIRPGGRSLSIWERMSQKNYVDALIVSSNLTMVKTTKLGSTLRDHAHDGRGCACSLMQDAPELNLEPLPRPEEIGLRTARNYDMMQRVSETTSAKRAEMRRLLTVVQGRFQSGDQATRNHYRDLELRLKEALRML